MKIYHYTSIETLALILRHKTIRFNRLDKVDDVEEACYGSGSTDINLCKYQFVSCWNKDQQENIALWKMYTNYKGVRIGLDEDMFVTYDINNHFKSYFKLPIDIMGNCLVTYVLNEAKLYDIKYVENIQDKIKDLVKDEGSNTFSLNMQEAGLYKRKEWEFQKESRFKICVFPINLEKIKIPKEMARFNAQWALMEALGPSICSNSPVSKDYFDIKLKDESLKSIEVMMGPMTSEGDRILVEELLASYNDAKITDSYFKGKIRR